MSIAENLKKVRSTLKDVVELVAVSKFHPVEKLAEAYAAGQRIFGESRVQELREKQPCLPEDVKWHFIGHLQTNKVKYIAPYISLIHAVDSLRLLEEINRHAEKVGRTIDCLLELHVAKEETKYGLTPEACRQLLADGKWRKLNNVRICGIMCMATNTDDERVVRDDFARIHALMGRLKKEFPHLGEFRELSIGMSGDWKIALEYGATIIRIGTAIFGPRSY